MDWGVFILCVVAVAIVLGILPAKYIQKIPILRKCVGWLTEHCGTRDKTLGYFTLSLTFMLLVQTTTNYQHGFFYQLVSDNMQATINEESGMSGAFKNLELPVSLVYWFFGLCALASGIAFLRGGKDKAQEEVLSAIKDLARRMTLLERNTHKDITDMGDKIVTAIKEQGVEKDDNKPADKL